MFTSFNEKQERYSIPRPPLESNTPGSTSTFNEVNKPVLPPDVDVVEDNRGYVMFVEAGENILPADATIPGPYPPPPPTVYSHTLSYSTVNCATACIGGTSVYYSLDATLSISSKLYIDIELTTPVANGYYSGNSNCYTIIDNLGTIDTISACVTCWQYEFEIGAALSTTLYFIDCSGGVINIDVGGGEQTTTINFCAQYGSPSTGEGLPILIGPCPPVYTYNLSYSSVNCSGACGGGGTNTYYSTDSSLTINSKLYTDLFYGIVSTLAPLGYYSGNGICYTVSQDKNDSTTRRITNISSCTP